MNIRDLKHIFFIGIGGIGMSALARYFNKKGVQVSGYDKTSTVLTKKLESEGINIHYEDNVLLIPENVELAVYTPAVPSTHKQLKKLIRMEGVTVLKRSQVLGLISENMDAIAVAGTHGKTSTSAMLSHILRYNSVDASGFIGGIMSDYDTNYFSGDSDWVVLEADEYDRSFLSLHPEIAILQSMDADHLDIYGSQEEMRTSFVEFLNKTSYGGTIIINHNLIEKFTQDELEDLRNHYKVVTFGTQEDASAVITEMKVVDGMSSYDLRYEGQSINVLQFMPGDHNRMNATAAIIAASRVGVDLEKAAASLSVFKGIKRRFEFVVRRDVIYIDDYAHHPTELRAAIGAARELFGGKKILGIFQPHLYSRTKDFYKEFARSLDELDEVVLMDIYPAREEPMKGVDSNLILEKIDNKNKSILNSEEILTKINEKKYDVIMTLGAGDIDLLVPKIKDILIG